MKQREQQKIQVSKSGESVLDGIYSCIFFTEFRIEYRHTTNKNCNLFWTQHSGEWKFACNGYKAGNTLFRNPNTLKTKEVPENGWSAWFGKGSVPVVKAVGNEVVGLVAEEEEG